MPPQKFGGRRDSRLPTLSGQGVSWPCAEHDHCAVDRKVGAAARRTTTAVTCSQEQVMHPRPSTARIAPCVYPIKRAPRMTSISGRYMAPSFRVEPRAIDAEVDI